MEIPIAVAQMMRRMERTVRSSKAINGKAVMRPPLNCVRLSLDTQAPRNKRRLTLQSADGFRLVRCELVVPRTEEQLGTWALMATPTQAQALRKAQRTITARPHGKLSLKGTMATFVVDGTDVEPDEGYAGAVQPDYEYLFPTEGRAARFGGVDVREQLKAKLAALPKRDVHRPVVYIHVQPYANANGMLMAYREPEDWSQPDVKPGELTALLDTTTDGNLNGDACTAPAAHYLLDVLTEFEDGVVVQVSTKTGPMLFVGPAEKVPGAMVRVALMPKFVGYWDDFYGWQRERAKAKVAT